VTAPEPYFADEHVQLFHGDMRELLPELAVQADACVTDPPYGETALAWDRWPDGWPALVAEYTNSMWCFGSMRMFGLHWQEFTGAAWRFSQDVVWRKPFGSGFQADRFRRVHEHAVFWYQGAWKAVHHDVPRVNVDVKRTYSVHRPSSRRTVHMGTAGDSTWVDDGTRLTESVIEARTLFRRGAIHPTQKPEAILAPLIEYATPDGGLVLDPFAGSASTLLTARTLGRRAVGIEASEEYCERAAKRLAVQDLFTGSAS